MLCYEINVNEQIELHPDAGHLQAQPFSKLTSDPPSQSTPTEL